MMGVIEMGMGTFLRIVMIAVGIFLMMAVISSLTKRKMTEFFCVMWGVIAVDIIVIGIMMRTEKLDSEISGIEVLILLMISFCILGGMYLMSSKISVLLRKNTELSIQTSLLNLKVEKMERQIEELMEKIDRSDEQ